MAFALVLYSISRNLTTEGYWATQTEVGQYFRSSSDRNPFFLRRRRSQNTRTPPRANKKHMQTKNYITQIAKSLTSRSPSGNTINNTCCERCPVCRKDSNKVRDFVRSTEPTHGNRLAYEFVHRLFTQIVNEGFTQFRVATPPRRFIACATCFITNHTPFTFTSINLWNVSALYSSRGDAGSATPALLNRMSIPPHCCSVAHTYDFTWISFETSASNPNPLPPAF